MHTIKLSVTPRTLAPTLSPTRTLSRAQGGRAGTGEALPRGPAGSWGSRPLGRIGRRWERAVDRLLRVAQLLALLLERSEEHTSELQSHHDLVCRLLLEKKKRSNIRHPV